MSPSIAGLAALLIVAAPAAAVTVGPPPGPDPVIAPDPLPGDAGFADPTPDLGAFHPPLPSHRIVIGGATRDADVTGVALDGSLAVIPEPRVWALLLAGYALIGFALRRRGWARRVAG